MEILVVGIGGNGQSYFMQYLKKKKFKLNCLWDSDKLKHISDPKELKDKEKECKVIYVYNKNFDAICSHFRRNWSIIQMNKINGTRNSEANLKIERVNNYFKLTEKTLVDHFGCKNHFTRWYDYEYPNGIYFLNLGNINKIELSKFLECDKSVLNDLNFDINKRNQYNVLKKEYILSDQMYKEIDNYMDDLGEKKNKELKLCKKLQET